MKVSDTFARLEPVLQEGLAALSLPADLAVSLLAYLTLLAKWNKAYNLTSVRDPQEMVSRHLLDSLSVMPFLHGSRILDVGTGPGLPGIPLALAAPQKTFTLLDSLGKKTRFIQQVINSIELANVTVVQSRIEDFQPAQGFSTVISRAFTSLHEMASLSRHCLEPGGYMLAMKGQYPQAELDELGSDIEILSIERLEVPGLSAERHLVIMRAH